jgi:hypothetical protein
VYIYVEKSLPHGKNMKKAENKKEISEGKTGKMKEKGEN